MSIGSKPVMTIGTLKALRDRLVFAITHHRANVTGPEEIPARD